MNINKQNTILATLITAVIMVSIAPTLSLIDNISAQQVITKKPDDKGKKPQMCKAQVKVILTGNLVVGQVYTVKIGDGKEQLKQLEEEEEEPKLVFSYNMNKQKSACPLEVPVFINGVQYSVPIAGKKNVLEITI